MIKNLQSRFKFHFEILNLSLAVLLFISFNADAQGTLWSDTFDSPAGGTENNNAGVGWNIVKGGGSNQWYINNGSLCGVGNRLHVGYSGNPTASSYASYNASESHAYSPAISTVGATGLNVTFIWKSRGLANQAYGEFGYSLDNGTTWTWLATRYQSTSGCTNASIPLPAAAENIAGLKLGFHWTNNQNLFSGQDPPFDVDDIKITCVTCPSSSGNTITTGTVTGSPFCAGASVSVPFNSTGTFNSGNTFTVQLSNAAGSFASPVIIGSGSASPIAATIPAGAATGSGYRVRVISSNPATTGTDNGTNITINATVTASVSVSASATTICQGGSVTFSATPTNGGGAPTYQWKVNGTDAGSGGAAFTSSSLNNNDVVTIAMTSNAACVTGSPANSSGITMAVNPSVAASVSITASATTVCPGSSVTFSATPSNGGAAPVYQWKINGTNAGSGDTAFTSSSLNNNDVVTVVMTSNAACVTGSPATSNGITMTVNSSVTASVSITSSAISICNGEAVSFTATPDNGGTTPTYQWKINGTNAGTDSDSFNSSSLNNNDTVTCILTSNAACVTGSPATSNKVIISVGNNASAGTISTTRDTICSGTPAVLNVNDSNGSLQWQSSSAMNSGFSNISGETNESYFAFPVSDTYYRTYSYVGNCSDTSVAYKITVLPSPEASFTYTQTSSNGKQITFDSHESKDASGFEWTLGDGTTDFTPNPIHTYAKDTIYHVCLTVYNGSNCSFTICKDIQTGATGISAIANAKSSWKIFPQPFNNFIVLQSNNDNSIEKIEIYDLLGRVLFSNNYNNLRTNSLRITLPELSMGLYLIKIHSSSSVDVLEILKQ